MKQDSKTKLIYIEKREPSLGERARQRACQIVQDQRESRARREALAFIERDESISEATRRASVRDEKTMEAAVSNLCWPIAASLEGMRDPLALNLWDDLLSLWNRTKLPLMFTVWSIGCFFLGMLV